MPCDNTDTTLCPLCGMPNQCAITRGDAAQSCWCMNTPIAPEALARIPPALRNVACICPRCAAGDASATVKEFDPHA